MTLVHTGDAIVPAAQATVPLLDHGFLFGDSVYDVVRTVDGKPFLLQPHLDRLRRSAQKIYFELPWSDADIRARLDALQEALGIADTYIRIIATRGPGPISLLPDGCDEPGLYLIGRELIRYPQRHYEKGCRVALVHRLRNDPRALDPSAKTGNYLNNMLGLVEAKRAGADDALFLNAEAHVTEATTANVWIVEKGRVVTPPLPDGILPGVTRDWILATLASAGKPFGEESIGEPRLRAADEVFLTGTIKGVMPVARVDDDPVGDGAPGPMTRWLGAAYEAALASLSRS